MMKKKCFLVFVVGGLLAGFSALSPANIVLFSDNFDSENGGNGVYNYFGFAKWSILDGSVDLIGNGYDDVFPGNGLYVDMDGSTNDAGKMLTLNTIDLLPGIYMLTFDLAGNVWDPSAELVTVEVTGGLLHKTYSLSQTDPFTTFTETFTVFSETSVSLSFEGAGGDNAGMLLDNVSLQLVPEPATICLLGLGALSLLRRKR